MLVTLIADASHCHRTKVAAYGYWAVSKRGRHGGHGVLKGEIRDSVVAEMMAIVNALHISIARGIAVMHDDILIQTDCLGAIGVLAGNCRKVREDLLPIVNAFLALQHQHDLGIRFKHVKGHSKVQDQRSKAQRMTDHRAKRTMRQARDAQKGTT